jgi:hypothetical protein
VPSSAIFFGGMVVEGERRSCNCGGMAVAPLKFGGEMGICGTFWRENEINGGNYSFCGRHRGPARCFARFCFVRSPRPRLEKPRMAWVLRMD